MGVKLNPFTGKLDVVDSPSGDFSTVELNQGTQTSPSISFDGDPNTGIYSPGADQVAISTNGTGRLFVDSNGRIGIGTANPQNKLSIVQSEVADAPSRAAAIYVQNNANCEIQMVGNPANDCQVRFGTSNDSFKGAVEYQLDVNALLAYTNGFERARITSDGKLGLGTSSPTSFLSAVGTGTTPIDFTATDAQASDNTTLLVHNNTNNNNAFSQIVLRQRDTSQSDVRLVAWNGDNPYFTIAAQRRLAGQEYAKALLTIGTATGRVGIGTVSPSQTLEIYQSNAGAFSTVRVANADGVGLNIAARSGANASIYATNSSDSLLLGTNSTERLRIDSAGNLLVGTSSSRTVAATIPQVQIEGTSTPTSSLSITRNSNDAGRPQLLFGKSRGTAAGSSTSVSNNDILGSIKFSGADGTNLDNLSAEIRAEVDGTPGTDVMPGRLVFSTTADGASSPTERMRITSDGYVAFGATAYFGSTIPGAVDGTSNRSQILGRLRSSSADSTNTRSHNEFYNPNGLVGSITTNASATAYNTSSDYRLKENVVPLTGATDRLKLIPVHRFNFIADPSKTVDGFLAHEAQAVVPESVTGAKDEVDDEGNPVYQGIDQSKIVPLVVAALQEVLAKIETLEARVTAGGL